MKKHLYIFSLILISFLITGCLTVETKEYTFKIKKDRSGSGSIKYINIMSDNKDSAGVAESDYDDLLSTYLHGNKLEEDMPGLKNVKKKLFEEDNHLCGEITFEFDDITKLKFYKYKEDGPWCYYINPSPFSTFSGSEAYFSSNGTWGGENIPVIFWDGNVKVFEFKTTMTAPGKNTVSLLDFWKKK